MNKTVLLGVVLVITSAAFKVNAQTSEEVGEAVIEPNLAPFPGERMGDRELMTYVVLDKLTIWIKPSTGERVYAANCRRHTHGCVAEITQLIDYIWEECRRQDFDPWLVAGIAWHESRFNPFAGSSEGAYGVLQILRRGRWANGLPFVRQPRYRRQCRAELGSCQQPVIERGIYWLRRSIANCGSVQGGLRVYNSGSCNGPRRYVRLVRRYMNEIKTAVETIRNNNFVDPKFPENGPVFVDDCAEPTIEETWCDDEQACDYEGVRNDCLRREE